MLICIHRRSYFKWLRMKYTQRRISRVSANRASENAVDLTAPPPFSAKAMLDVEVQDVIDLYWIQRRTSVI